MTNVLVTSAGRRNYLISYFAEAVHPQGMVIAADLNGMAPGLQEADRRVVTPPASHPEFTDAVLSICTSLDVKLVVPLNDLELHVFARDRARFESAGIQIAVSSESVVQICLDKLLTDRWLRDSGFRGPSTFWTVDSAIEAVERGKIEFPLIVKPRWGSGSIGVETVADKCELKWAFALGERRLQRSILAGLSSRDPEKTILIQEHIDGQEFGLDVINDLENNYVATLVRKKIGMRAGETDKAEVLSSPLLEAMGAKLGRALKHRGNLDVDVIVQKGEPVLIEMNPRFGGGYPFCHEAGADLPSALVSWVEGRSVPTSKFDVRTGSLFAKCDRLVEVGRSPIVNEFISTIEQGNTSRSR